MKLRDRPRTSWHPVTRVNGMKEKTGRAMMSLMRWWRERERERGEDEHVKLDVCALLLLLLLLMSPLNVWILNLGIKYSCGGALDPHVGLLTNKHSSLLDFTSALNVSWSKDTLRCCYRLQVLSVWYDQLWRIKCQNVTFNLVIYQLNGKWTHQETRSLCQVS